MFGIGGGEFIALLLFAMILIGPDKLPQFSTDSARFIRKVRDIAQGATKDLRENLGPGYEDLKVTDLHPKKFITKHINEVLAEPSVEIQELKKSAKIDPDLL
ncbi:TatA Sec-independent protein secretion pathway components [actinobacterium SCGC AAA044-D11]